MLKIHYFANDINVKNTLLCKRHKYQNTVFFKVKMQMSAIQYFAKDINVKNTVFFKVKMMLFKYCITLFIDYLYFF